MADIHSPQANIPSGYRSNNQLLRDGLVAQKLNMEPPELVTANGQVFANDEWVAFRLLQNCGTNAVKVAIGSVAGEETFHWILNACQVQDDGTGGVLDLSRIKGNVTIFSTSGTHRVATFLAYAPERLM